ncbi:hypothetical protein ACFOPQ_01685 [Deinococcus antarcticus]|uniref:5-methylcytosine-specific restriction enzyme subunit McrC n=1 Tax=Deinococcus antarcticus TaxID=1298767 RepID=A0ABV8A252_9DEIO
MTLTTTAPSSTDTLWAEEESTIFLPTHSVAQSVSLGGRGLMSVEDRERTPYVLDFTPRGVSVRLTDWVGRLDFETEGPDGLTIHHCQVYPAKLHPDPYQAFTALGRMIDDLPQFKDHLLNFPTVRLPRSDLVRSRPLSISTLLSYAAQAQQLWQEARRQPRPSVGHHRRVTTGGAVPDRVDWSMTLEHWGQGGFPDHVARDLHQLPPPVATAAIRELWESLIAAAHLCVETQTRETLRKFQLALNTLPEPLAARAPEQDRLAVHARRLSGEVRSLAEEARGIPTGHTRMALLYEVWAMLAFCQALGVREGAFYRDEEGFYVGTLSGEGVSVQLNLNLDFTGVGPSQQKLRPDLLAIFNEQEAVVADVKYRPMHRLSTEQQRAINDQLLRYMGLTHARTGLVLWPGDGREYLWQGQIPGGRARLGRLRLNPLDPLHDFTSHLASFGLQGGS